MDCCIYEFKHHNVWIEYLNSPFAILRNFISIRCWNKINTDQWSGWKRLAVTKNVLNSFVGPILIPILFSLAIPGTLDLGNLNMSVYLITYLFSFPVIQNLTQNLGINRLQTITEGLKGYFLFFTLHSRLRWVCRKLPTAAGEACKQLWRSAQTSARTENRKQLPLRKAFSAIHGSLEGQPFAKSCAARPWPLLAAAAGQL